jgi:MFS family permease
MTSTAPAGTYRAALRVPEFDALAGTSVISVIGDAAAYLAVTVLVYQRTNSPFLSALTFAIAFLPYLFGGTLLSAMVDRFAPKTLLIGIDLVGATLVALAAIPGVPLPLLFAGLFLIGSLAPVRSGTATALIAEILPGDTFVAGRSIQRIGIQTGQIVGTGLGGLLIAGFGPQGALLADSASFVVSAVVIALVVSARPGRAQAVDRPSLIADSLGGIRLVWSAPAVRQLLLLSWLVPFVAVAPEGLAAPAVAQSGQPAGLVGLWMAAIPVGTVLGDLLAVWIVPPAHRSRLTWPLAFVLAALMVVFAADPPFAVSIGLLVAAGAASAYGLGLDQRLRDRTPPELQARTFTLNSTGLMVSQGLGFAAAGALGQFVPAHHAIALAGVLGLVIVLFLSRSPGHSDRQTGGAAVPERAAARPGGKNLSARRTFGRRRTGRRPPG